MKPKYIKFNRQQAFRNTLRERVDAYFESNQLRRRDQPAMFFKTFVIMAWFIASYSVLVFAPVPIWARIAAAVSLGLAGAGVGFSIMHDAGHGAYSDKSTLNKIVFFSLDFLGGSSIM